MTTEQRLLTAQGDELLRLLGEVFRVIVQHQWRTPRQRGGGDGTYCTRCGISKVFIDDHQIQSATCQIQTTDWSVAMKWRDWLQNNFTFEQITKFMVIIFAIGVDDSTGRINELNPENMKHQAHYWFAIHADECDWLRLVALCKLKGNGN